VDAQLNPLFRRWRKSQAFVILTKRNLHRLVNATSEIAIPGVESMKHRDKILSIRLYAILVPCDSRLSYRGIRIHMEIMINAPSGNFRPKLQGSLPPISPQT